MSTVETVRAEILAEVEGRTFCDTFAETVAAHGSKRALTWLEGERWVSMTWDDYARTVHHAALGLRALGVAAGDAVAIQVGNQPEHVIADLAAVHAGGIGVSVYATLAPAQIAHVASDAVATVAILAGPDELARWREVQDQLPKLAHFVLLTGADTAAADDVISWDDLVARGKAAATDGPSLTTLAEAVRPDDLATLVYTSGTTGAAKGVPITHANLEFTMASVQRVFAIPTGDQLVSYLPLAHIAERMLSHYQGVRYASNTHFCADISKVVEAVQRARPWMFLGVPRVWEKVRTGVLAKVDAGSAVQARLAHLAIKTAIDKVEREQRGQSVPLPTQLLHRLLEPVVLSKIRAGLGLDRCELAVTGAAACPRDLAVFFAAVGLPLHDAYGMTETTAITHAQPRGAVRIGTVGKALPGVECRIADDGEILVRGPNMTSGYRNRPEATAELFADDGWLRTGDIGKIDDDGYLSITGRSKELIITAGGKNIAPTEVEEHLKAHELVGQALAYGDDKPYITALLVLDPDTAPKWADKLGVGSTDLTEMAAAPAVREELERAVAEANRNLARVQQVKKFAVLGTDWTPESGELTPSMKLRRSVVHERYRDEIEALY